MPFKWQSLSFPMFFEKNKTIFVNIFNNLEFFKNHSLISIILYTFYSGQIEELNRSLYFWKYILLDFFPCRKVCVSARVCVCKCNSSSIWSTIDDDDGQDAMRTENGLPRILISCCRSPWSWIEADRLRWADIEGVPTCWMSSYLSFIAKGRYEMVIY